MSRYTLATALLSLFILVVVDNTRAHEGSEIDSQGGGAWSYLPIEMPTPLSDMSVDVISLNGSNMEKSIILTGGCDSPDGNVFYEAEWGEGFACSSVTSKVRSYYGVL